MRGTGVARHLLGTPQIASGSDTCDADRRQNPAPIYKQVPVARDGELIVLRGTVLSDDAHCFLQALYGYGWVRTFDWTGWRATAEGERLLHDPDAIAGANEDDLARVLTTCACADRFCEGYLA